MKPITCDSCSHRFTPTVVTEQVTGFMESVLTQRVSTDGELWHFACPSCGHRYDVCHITRQGIELRRQLDSVKAQLRLAPHNTALAAQSGDLLAKLAAEITDLTTPPTPQSTSKEIAS